MAAVASIPLGWHAAALEALEAQIVPVRARLQTTDLKEWFAGNGDWYAAGTFEITTPGGTGTAVADLAPPAFYGGRGRRRRPKTARETAALHLRDWRVGAVYDGLIYPDVSDKLFFERPGAGEARALVDWVRGARPAVCCSGSQPC